MDLCCRVTAGALGARRATHCQNLLRSELTKECLVSMAPRHKYFDRLTGNNINGIKQFYDQRVLSLIPRRRRRRDAMRNYRW